MTTFLNTSIISLLSLTLGFSSIEPNASQPFQIEEIKPIKISAFNRIAVSGNVEILLVSRPTIGIHYADDNEGKAKVTQQGNILRINGNSIVRTKVIVYINDIYRIEAKDKAIIHNEGLFTTKFLQIIMKDNAMADMNINAEGLYTEISESAILKLEGNAKTCTLFSHGASKLIINNFISNKVNTDISNNI